MDKSQEESILDELLDLLKKKRPEIKVERIKKAFEFAREAHEGQHRMSGEPYVCHPLEVAKILAKIQADENTIVAGLLHDVPEDTDFSISDVEQRFGRGVAQIVSALTKLSKVYYKHSMGERQIQSLRKVFLETSKDPRVIFVKLADRLHNMKTLQYLRPEKQQRIASETMEIYAPLANLYGIYQIRRRLEDLCFLYLQPEEYARIDGFIHDHEEKRTHFINDTIEVLKSELRRAGIKAAFQGRPKHFYSIYQKTIRDQKVLQDIFDYFAIRIITADPNDCYKAMGIVHKVFKPKPGRVKDYIALPKPNGYQSLHTTVIGLRGKLTEVQIRTEEMHLEAEFGVAAHSQYKDSEVMYINKSISKLKREQDSESFIRGLQDDLLHKRIFVFSPEGKIVNLPEGATCIDYIYSVNFPVDKKKPRVLVNGKVYSLVGELQSGDHVEVLLSKKDQDGPERWWLEHVKTAEARESILAFFRKKSFAEKVELGEKLLQQELDHENQGLIYNIPQKNLTEIVQHFVAGSFEDILAGIGEGSISTKNVYRLMFPELDVELSVQFIRFIKGLRRKFTPKEDSGYKVQIVVESYDKQGLLMEVLQPFYDLNIPMIKMVGEIYKGKERLPDEHHGPLGPIDPTKFSRDTIDIEVERQEELITLFDKIEKIPGTIRVFRVFKKKQLAFFTLLSVVTAYVLLHPFILMYVHSLSVVYGEFWEGFIVYFGLFAMLGLMFWLRHLAKNTFSHFEETGYFWPLSFGLSLLGIVMLLVDDAVFDLHLQMPFMIAIALVILLYLTGSYQLHKRRRARHLTRLKESRLKAAERTKSKKK